MAFKTIEDYDRLARTNEDRYHQIEVECNRALELINEGDIENAKLRIDQAAYFASDGVNLNLVATQK